MKKDLEVREEGKHLGVTFAPTLKFSKHVGVIANKANTIVGLAPSTTWMKRSSGPLYITRHS